MLEIIVFIIAARHIAALARTKGQSAGSYALALGVAWLAGMGLGMVCFELLDESMHLFGVQELVAMVACTWTGSGLGAWAVFTHLASARNRLLDDDDLASYELG